MSNGKSITATSRLQQDYVRLKKDPVPYIVAEPLPSNICEWYCLHLLDIFILVYFLNGSEYFVSLTENFGDCFRHYVVLGPEGTPYVGGLYHGKLVFPRQFPFKPPSIYMITPNGR